MKGNRDDFELDINLMEEKGEKGEESKGFDVVFDYIPRNSRYQTWVGFLGIYLGLAAGAIQCASILFLAEPDQITCVDFGNGTIENSELLEYRNETVLTERLARDDREVDESEMCFANCTQYSYTYSELEFVETGVTLWDLVCERSMFKYIMTAVALSGLLFGALFFGYLSDVIGRKNALFWCTVGSIFSSLAVTFLSYNVYLFMAFRFLSGAFIHGTIPVSLVYAIEFVAAEYRSWFGAAAYVIFDMGLALLSPIGSYLKDWRHMSLAISTIPIPFLIFFFMIPKSFQFTYARGNYKEGKQLLKNIMIKTGSDLSKLEQLSKKLEAVSHTTPKTSIRELFTPEYRVVTAQVGIIFFSTCMGYYGFLLNPTGIPGNMLFNNVIMALVDAIGFIMGAYLINKFGRVQLLTTAFLATGITCIMSSFMQTYTRQAETGEEDWASIFVKMFIFGGKISNAIAFGACFNWTAELYPTYLRGLGVGFGSSVARIGGMMSPLVLSTKRVSPILPAIIIGMVSMITSVVSYSMPETNGQPLMQTREEATAFYRESRKKVAKRFQFCNKFTLDL